MQVRIPWLRCFHPSPSAILGPMADQSVLHTPGQQQGRSVSFERMFLSNGRLLAAGVCLVTAVCCVTECTVQAHYGKLTCRCCLTAGLPLDSKYGPVRQQLQQKLVKFF